MKKLTITFLISILLLGCATKTTKVENNEVKISKEELAAQTLLAETALKELVFLKDEIKEQKKAWNDFILMVIKLDKNKKPIISKNVEIKNIKDFFTFTNGPKITITDFSTTHSVGKMFQFNCKNNDVKQKFESAMNLPGWSLETTCNKDSYFFIVNKKDQ